MSQETGGLSGNANEVVNTNETHTVSRAQNQETKLDEKKEKLLNVWQESYNSFLSRDEKHKKTQEFVSELKNSPDRKYLDALDIDSIARKNGISRDQLFSVMPEIYKQASEEELTSWCLKLNKEEYGKKSQNERYDFMDKVIQNTPKDILNKMVKADGYFGKKVSEMLNVYGGAIGGLMKSTEDINRRDLAGMTKALNYMGSAGRFMDKKATESAVVTMVNRFIDSGNQSRDYNGVNYANLCEAGFTDEVEKMLSKGIQKRQIGLIQIMELKEKGFLNDEQVKKLALEENNRNIEDANEKIKKNEDQLLQINKELILAGGIATDNPDRIVDLSNYGLGKGKVGELIGAYKEYAQKQIEQQKDYIESERRNLRKLKE